MSREFFTIEKGLKTTAADSEATAVYDLFGGTAPGGTTDTDAATVGSVYKETTSGALYQKRTAGSGTDKWERMARVSDVTAISFRSEKVMAVTAQAAPGSGSVLNLTTTPLTGDDAPTLAATDFTVNDHIIFGFGGTPKLMRVSVVASPNITVVDADIALRENDKFVANNYLPDSPDGQEKQVLLQYQSSTIVKLADFNWNLADGISLNGAIVNNQGPVVGTDSVQVAIEKLEGDCKDAAVLSGVARGATDLGTFTSASPFGSTIQATRTIKQALQDLQSFIEGNGRTSILATTTITTLDSILVDNLKAAKWLVYLRKSSTPTDCKAVEIFAMHNGSGTADATGVDETIYAKTKLGNDFNAVISFDVSGSGVSQVMRLRITSSEVGGVDAYAVRTDAR